MVGQGHVNVITSASLFGEWAPWADPEMVAHRRMPMRVPLTAHRSARAALSGDRERSPWWKSLNGEWQAKRWSHPSLVPQSAVHESTATWSPIQVPGNWTMQDFVDQPHYTNIVMPWNGLPPGLPEELSTLVYRRTFDLPKDWQGRRIIIHVGGAESVHGVWVNGRLVGWGSDSRLASEYDITDLVESGSNDLAIVVTRYSAQSYLEDQDQWWMAGLHREVFVEARSAIHLADVNVDASIKVSSIRNRIAAGSVRIRAYVGIAEGTALSPGWSVRAQLQDQRGKKIGVSRTIAVPVETSAYLFEGFVAKDEWSLTRVETWSAESPSLYTMLVTLIDPQGKEVEHVAVRCGFRSVEVRDRSLLINGQRVIIRGVNRHDHSPTNGKAVTLDEMRADLMAMKRHNVNAVRCAHYPNDPRLLDLCDELGLYVVDEANAEAHAFNTSLWRDSRWHSSWIARVARMVQRDRNHPSVIMWSLGNEAGYGPIHDSAAEWVRSNDSSRPLHYEPAIFHTNWVDGGRQATDVVCPMYSPIEAIVAYGKSGRGDRPLIMCEFSHAMGNSNGSLADYVKAFETVPGLQGGFVWEWKDHALHQRLSDGRTRLAYGGQFGDVPNDANFVADGLMHADLTPHPAMRELAWVHRPVAVAVKGVGARRHLVVSNRRHFTDLGDLVGEWTMTVEGESIKSGRWKINVAAGRQRVLPLPCAVPASGEVHLIVRWRTRDATAWCDKGHLVAWDCLALTPGRSKRVAPAKVVNPSATAAELAPRLTLWRAPTDNDGMKLAPHLWPMFGKSLQRWLEQGVDSRNPEDLVKHRHEVERRDDGSVLHRHVVTVPKALADLPRIGVRFELPVGFERLRWFGDGPHECYPDRRSSSVTSVWEANPDELPYLVPQEHGLRTNCRWMEFSKGNGSSSGDVIRVTAVGQPLHMSALFHTPEDLYEAPEQGLLVRRDSLTVHIDVAHRGLGTASCGPDTLEQYRVASGRYEFAYVISSRRSTPARRQKV